MRTLLTIALDLVEPPFLSGVVVQVPVSVGIAAEFIRAGFFDGASKKPMPATP